MILAGKNRKTMQIYSKLCYKTVEFKMAHSCCFSEEGIWIFHKKSFITFTSFVHIDLKSLKPKIKITMHLTKEELVQLMQRRLMCC